MHHTVIQMHHLTMTTTVLATAPEAPESSMMDEFFDSNLLIEPRPRKYSEGYREIESVDQDSGGHLNLSDETRSSSTREPPLTRSTDKLPSPVEEGGEDDCETADDVICSDNDIGASSPSSVTRSNKNENSENVLVPSLVRSVSFLDSLPVAAAEPEIATTLATVISVQAVATQVTRLPPLGTRAEKDRRASLISVKVFKASSETKLGIRFQLSNDGNLQLGKITGLLADSPLRLGDEVLLLNGQNVSAWTTTKALKYLRETWGWITIVVRNPKITAEPSFCLASVCKSSPSDKLGISFQRHNLGFEAEDHSPLTIRGLNVAGLLGGRTTIRVGDVVESINQVSCAHLDNDVAVSMIRSVPDWVHILVRKNPLEVAAAQGQDCAHHEVEVSSALITHGLIGQDEHPVLDTTIATELAHPVSFIDRNEHMEASLVSLTLYKEQKSDKLGLQLVKLNDDIYIKKISGFLSGSILKEGMVLLSINHQSIARMVLSEASGLLKDRVGSITLLARNPHGNPKYVQAMVYKKKSQVAKDNLVGVSFKGSAGRQLKICQISPDGLFVKSCLNVGDSVLQINDIPCRYSRPKEAVDLVRSGQKCVSVLARSKSKAAAVVAHVGTSSAGNNNNNTA